MSPPKLISVCLATHNEAANLARCLDSVSGLADEIIIADGQSTDATVSLAKKYHAKIITTTNKPNFHINKNLAIAAATSRWILQLDADEAVSPQLKTEIKHLVTSRSALAGYWIPRLNNFLGRFLTKGGQYPDYTLRLYRRGLGKLPAKDVHEQAQVAGEVGYLKHDLLHYGTPDFENYLLRFNRYTSLTATSLAERHLTPNFINSVNYVFIKPLLTFLKIFVRHKGFVDGFPGFVFALFSGLHHAVAYIKYWQQTLYP